MRATEVVAAFLTVVVLFTAGVRAEETAGSETPEATAMKRLAEAKDLWHRKADFNGALAAFNEAVELAPDDVTIRIQRGNFFESVAKIVVEQDREKFEEFAREDYRFVTAADPNSLGAGVARDGLARLDGRDLFPEQAAACPEDAVRAYERAESLFHQGRYEASLESFGVARSACPASAPMRVAHADAYYMLEDYDKAKALFLEALGIDPWNRQAHRFLSDALNRLGDNEAALRHAALAVVSDPTYEAAWSSLRGLSRILGRGWDRAYGEKPQVARDAADGGDTTGITVTLPTVDDGEDGTEGGEDETVVAVAVSEEGEDVDPDQVLWMAYAIAKASAMTGTIVENDDSGQPVAREIDPAGMSPFELEEHAVSSALTVMQELAEETSEERPSAGPFWAMMDRASDAGYLREAVYLHLMDENLVDEYLAYREANAGRLVEYLESLVTPVQGDGPEARPAP